MSNITDALPISKKDLMSIINNLIPSGAIMWFDLDEPPEGWEVYTPLVGKYPLGAETDIGSNVDAGLPNITGLIGESSGTDGKPAGVFIDKDAGTGNGALSVGTTMWTSGLNPGSAYGFNQLSFDASRCSSVYKDSVTTVTPPSVKLLPCRKK